MDVRVGQGIPPWAVESVDAARMKTMAAILRDPNPIHWDVEAVKRLGLGDRVVNQGPNNLAYVMNMLVAWVGDARLVKAVRVRFTGNVFAGDRLVAGGTVTGVREDGGGRAADCEVWLDCDDGTRVLAGTATVAIP